MTRPRLAVALLALAGAISFLALGSFLADGLPTWHEEVSIQSNLGYRVLPERVTRPAGGRLQVEPWCGDGTSSRRWVLSASRPTLTLCLGGRALPVMTMPYASGVFAWPMLLFEPVHRDDVFVQRQIGLVRGLLALALLFGMVRRLAGDWAAALACFFAGTSAPFVYPHVFLFPYETLPWTLIAGAFWVWSRSPELSPGAPRQGPAPSWSTLLGGAALAGLAVLANVKALFVFAPLLLAAWRSGATLRRIRPLQWAALLVTAAAACSPVWIFGLVDPAAGLSGQLAFRISTALHKARPEAVAREVVNLLTFGSDVGFYMEQVGGKAGTLFLPALVAVAVPIGYVVGCGVLLLAGRPRGSRLAGTCGVVIAAYYLVSLLLYDQFPSANYSPLHCVFGASYAAFALDAGRALSALAQRRGRSWPAWLPVAIVSVPLATLLIWATVRRGDPAAYMKSSLNAEAERRAARYLLAHPSDGEIVTTTDNLAGVIEALGKEQLHPVQAHPLLQRCRGRSGDDLFTCVKARLRWIMGHEQSLPLRFLVPALVTGADAPPEVHEVVPRALADAAADLGLALSAEASFATRRGDEVLRLYRVMPTGGSPGTAPPP